MKQSLTTITLLAGVLSACLCSAAGHGGGGKPTYKSAIEVAPSGSSNAVVYVFIPQPDGSEGKSPLLYIPMVGDVRVGYAPETRARIIAQRATDETDRTEAWYRELKIDHANGEWVLKTGHGVFVTMDRQYLNKLKQVNGIRTDEAILLEMINEIKSTLNPNDPDLWNFSKSEEQQLMDAHFGKAANHMKQGLYNYTLYRENGSRENLLRAIGEYGLATKENPHNTAAIQELVALYKLAGQNELTAAWQTRLDGIEKAMPEVQLGDEAAAAKKWPEAVVHYKAAVRKYPDCISFYLLLADAYQGAKDVADELKTLQNIPDEALATGSTAFRIFREDRLKKLLHPDSSH